MGPNTHCDPTARPRQIAVLFLRRRMVQGHAVRTPPARANSGGYEFTALLPRLIRALGSAAALCLELGRIERAVQLREAFKVGARRAVCGNACHGFRRKCPAGLTRPERVF